MCVVALTAAAAPPAASAAVFVNNERRQPFTDGWRFHKGDSPGAERPEFDDSQWRPQRLPHDWAIEGPFDPKLNPHTGALLIFGVAWHRKTFTLPAGAKDRFFQVRRRHVERAGVAERPRPGRAVLAVRLSPEDRSSRWYSGAAVYRFVWLDMTGPQHVPRWGTYIMTPRVTDEASGVSVKTEVRNRSAQEARVVLRSSVSTPAGGGARRNTGNVAGRRVAEIGCRAYGRTSAAMGCRPWKSA